MAIDRRRPRRIVRASRQGSYYSFVLPLDGRHHCSRNQASEPVRSVHSLPEVDARALVEGRGQKTEVRSQKSEDRSQKSEVRRQRSEDRRQKSEVRSQKSEVRSQKS